MGLLVGTFIYILGIGTGIVLYEIIFAKEENDEQ